MAQVKRLLVVCALLALARPHWRSGDGSGSDDRGDYSYRWARLTFARFAVEFHWWAE